MEGAAVYYAIAAIVSAAGTAYSSYEQGKIADYNAEVDERDAEAARQKAKYDETAHRERVRKLLSTQRAQYGQSGIEQSGSPLLVMEDTAAQGELDALAIRYGGRIQSDRFMNSASSRRRGGRAARTSGAISAGSTLLGGAARYSAG